MSKCDCDQYVGMGEHFCGRPNEDDVEAMPARIKELERELFEYRKMAARYRESDERSDQIRALTAIAEAATVLIRSGDRKYEKDLAVALGLLPGPGEVPVR